MSQKSIFLCSDVLDRSNRRRAALTISVALFAACSGGGTGGGDNPDGGPGGSTDMAGQGSGPPVTVTVMRAGSGNGKVTSTPPGIDCGGSGTCMATFGGGTMLTLTAQGIGSAFSGWTGACAGQSAVCQITVNSDTSVTASFDPLTCSPDFICWEAPLPFGMDLSDVYAIANNNVWAIGTAGTVVHYDGTSWTRSPTNTKQDLRGIWARNASDVWVAAGLNGLMLHYDGASWNNVSTGTAQTLTDVYAAGTSNLYVTTLTDKVLHSTNNGTSFTSFASGGRVNVAQLLGLTGTGPNDVWAWGLDNTISHWNGLAWSLVTRSYTVSGLWSAAAGDTWAMTNTGDVYRDQGAAFAASGKVATAAASFQTLWGTSTSNMFTLGPIPNTNPPNAVIYRYNGTSWGTIDTGQPTSYLYTSLHGASANDIWAVGPGGVTTHTDGATATTARANVFKGTISSIWGTGVNDVWFSTSGRTVVHYDGIAYKESQPLVTSAGSAIAGLGGSAPDDVWVGASDNNLALLMHYNGTSWSRSDVPTAFSGADPAISLVWASGKNNAWATGSTVSLPLHWDGSSWQIDTTVIPNGYATALWGTSASDVWLSGGGELWHYNGTAWTKNTGITVPVYSFSGTGPNDVWAGVDTGAYHYNGTTWTKYTVTGSTLPINSISATATNDVWFVDLYGGVFRWNGSTFTQLGTTLNSVVANKMTSWAANAQNVWFGGPGILSYRR